VWILLLSFVILIGIFINRDQVLRLAVVVPKGQTTITSVCAHACVWWEGRGKRSWERMEGREDYFLSCIIYRD
jgi:hypothetical protein